MQETITIKVTPKASSNRIKRVMRDDGAEELRVYVTCAPEDGKANEAVIALLAKEWGVAKSKVTITHGHTSRTKTLRIDA